MSLVLVVTRQFGPYKVGDRITDAATIDKVRASDNHANVVAANHADPEPPAPPVPANTLS